MTFETSSPVRRVVITGSLPITIFGLVVVTIALMAGPWPPDPANPLVGSVSYLDRLRGQGEGSIGVRFNTEGSRGAVWYARRALDGAAVGLTLAGYASVIVAIQRHTSRALIALTLIGGAGVIYAATVGLYAGPILALGGFSLVLIGAGLGWASLISERHRTGQTGLENHEPYSAA
jgi:hypothetical protein